GIYGRNDPGHKARDSGCVVFKLREFGAQELLFASNYREINRQEKYNDNRGDPGIERGDAKAYRDNNGAEVKRVACVSVGACRGELFVFAHVARSGSSHEQTDRDKDASDCDACSTWLREPHIQNGEDEAQRHANTAGDFGPTN